MSKASKDQRIKLYKDHNVQLLISKFVSGELSKLNPVYDPKYGYRYPVVDVIVGDPSGTDELLQSLSEAGVLKRELYDKIVYCPSCDTANVSMHYCCPHCKSFDVRKSALIEHIQCGYIDIEEKFRKDDKLVCPRCRKELTKPDVDYHKAGVWCTCNECGKSFDIPVPAHFCRDCRRNFTFEESLYKDVYSYSLTPEAMKEATLGWILITPIREFLESRGFEVESPGFLKGKSGASHMFDIIASPTGVKRNITVIDLATSADDIVSEQPVIAMFAKTYDVSPDKACLVAIPRMSENGKKLAALYKLELIEAKDQNDAIKALNVCMKKKK
jgi:transcription elongation factor Elf1